MSQNYIRDKSVNAGSGWAWAKRFTLRSRLARMAVVVVAFALYALAFFALNRLMGPAASTLALLPVVVAGWLQGMRGGLLAGALCFPLNVLFLNIAGMQGWTIMFGSAGGASGTVFLFFVGGIVGRMSDLAQRAARELAERKQAEEALRESEERLRNTLESMMEGCQIIGYDWRYLYLNDSAATHGQRNKDELLGHTMMECYPGIEKSDMFAVLRRCMDERTSHHMDNEFTYPDGSKGWFELGIQPVPEGIFILSLDITERKRAEEALKNSEKRFRALIENGRDNISLLAVDGTLLWESPSVVSTLGYAPNQFVGRNIFELMHPDDQDWTRDLYAKVVQTPGSSQDGVFRLLHGDGGWRWIEATATNLLNKPMVQAIVINYRDITERRQAEEALRKKDERHRNVVESIFRFVPEGLLVFTENFNLVNQNKAFGELVQQYAARLGYTEQELVELIAEQARRKIRNGDTTEIQIPKKRR